MEIKHYPRESLGSEHSKNSIRLWLRLLSCSSEIEKLLRNRMKEELSTTLPRFDVMAALERNPDGLTMGELSSLLMVSNGNVTAVVDRLEKDALIERVASQRDRRVYHVSLTDHGRERFATMAVRHEDWLDDLFSGLDNSEIDQLMGLLARLRRSVEARKIRD